MRKIDNVFGSDEESSLGPSEHGEMGHAVFERAFFNGSSRRYSGCETGSPQSWCPKAPAVLPHRSIYELVEDSSKASKSFFTRHRQTTSELAPESPLSRASGIGRPV